jgi:hypothetical protein
MTGRAAAEQDDRIRIDRVDKPAYDLREHRFIGCDGLGTQTPIPGTRFPPRQER